MLNHFYNWNAFALQSIFGILLAGFVCLGTGTSRPALAQGSGSHSDRYGEYSRDDYAETVPADEQPASRSAPRSGSDYYGLPDKKAVPPGYQYPPAARRSYKGPGKRPGRNDGQPDWYTKNDGSRSASGGRRDGRTSPPYAPPASYGRSQDRYGRERTPLPYQDRQPVQEGNSSAKPWKNPDLTPYREPGRETLRRQPERAGERYDRETPLPPPGRLEEKTYSPDEIINAGHKFFGKINAGLAKVVQNVFAREGRPVGYILGEEGSGAVVAGLNYGEGTLYSKYWGTSRIFWQGPSIGYDFGANGARTLTLVYKLNDLNDLYGRYGGVSGSAYVVGGVGITFQKKDNILLARIRSGVGLRLGANMGYLKYTRRPTWNPF